MRKTLLFMAFLATGSLAQAQDYTVSPSNTDTVIAPFNQLSIFDIYQINNASSKILLKWENISVNLPAGWDYSLCDYGHCYTGIPASGTMDSVNVGSMGLLGLNINPYSISGQGVVKLYVYQDGFYNNGDTITWHVSTSGTASVTENNTDLMVSMFPNPVQDQLTLQAVDANAQVHVQVYAMNGDQVHQVTFSGQTQIDLTHLSAGIYTVRARWNDGRQMMKKIVKE